MNIRSGLGFDAHRFSDHRKLMLGGVEIQHHQGLRGHSDADVVLHALSDALLGAAGLGDIGTHFPDSDPTWKDASSRIFVERILEMLARDHWTISNTDLTIIAQVPKISPYRHTIRKSVSEILKIDESLVNVKATTSDTMGFIGREEGIAAMAVVLIRKDDSTQGH